MKAAAKILTASQADAIYSAMCALNNVSARVDVFCPGDGAERGFHVRETSEGKVVIHTVTGFSHPPATMPEIHESQAEFATAYGLQQG